MKTNPAEDAMKRLYNILERGYDDTDETLEEIEQIVRAWHYGESIASTR